MNRGAGREDPIHHAQEAASPIFSPIGENSTVVTSEEGSTTVSTVTGTPAGRTASVGDTMTKPRPSPASTVIVTGADSANSFGPATVRAVRTCVPAGADDQANRAVNACPTGAGAQSHTSQQ